MSKLLRVIAWYFKLGGIIFAFVAVSGLIGGVALHWPASTSNMPYRQALLIVSAASVSLFVTGILLARRLRIGGILGFGLTLYPFAFDIWNRRLPTPVDLAVAAVTVVALLLVWRELEWRTTSDVALRSA